MKREPIAKAKSSVKNIIKIAIGELKRKRKKKPRKRRVGKPKEEVVRQPDGQSPFGSKLSPPFGISGVLQLGREFRDVQISQKQLTDSISSSLRNETRRRQDQIDDAYRDLRRRITNEQRSREMVQETAERGAQLAINTARALEAEGQKGFLSAGISLIGRTVGLGAVKVPKPEVASPQQIVEQGQGISQGGAKPTLPLDPRSVINRQGLTREGLVRVLERLGEDTKTFYSKSGKLSSNPTKSQLINMVVSSVEQGGTSIEDLDRYVVDAITKEQNPTPSKYTAGGLPSGLSQGGGGGSDPNALEEEEPPNPLFY
jgi:hypothetical protein